MEDETKKYLDGMCLEGIIPTDIIGNIQYNLCERFKAASEVMIRSSKDYEMFMKCFGYLKGLAYAIWLVDTAKRNDIKVTTIFDDGGMYMVKPDFPILVKNKDIEKTEENNG